MNNLPSSITLCEVGLRDGLQNEKTLLPTEEKISLFRGLIDAGFKVIEVGSFMHPKAVPQMADTDEVFKAIGQVPGVELRALIPNLRGVQRAVDCGCKKVKLNVSASRQHNLKNLNMTPPRRAYPALPTAFRPPRTTALKFPAPSPCPSAPPGRAAPRWRMWTPSSRPI